jgi:hypothetical protein
MGSMGIGTSAGGLAKGWKPVVARTGSGLATTRTGLMTLAYARAPAFSGPNQQRLPCTMRYCQYPARSDAGGKLVRHLAYVGSTDNRTLHERTATNAPRGHLTLHSLAFHLGYGSIPSCLERHRLG